MNKEIAFIAFEFARRKVRFYNNYDWQKIRLFGLFSWCEISKYLVGNPANIKTFKGDYVKTDMRKENKLIWCQPTEMFWNKYVLPIMNRIENMDYKHKLRYVEDEGVIAHYEEYKRLVKENESICCNN